MAKTNRQNERAPLCVGDYEAGDSVCDGNPGDAADNPCGWRDRCSGLQCYLNETDRDIDELVHYKVVTDKIQHEDEETGETWTTEKEQEYAFANGPWKKFETLCDKQAERYGIVEGTPTKDPVGDPPPKPEKKPQPDKRKFLKPSKKAQKAAKKALTKRAQERREQLAVVFQHFVRHLATELNGTGYGFVGSKQALGRGSLYVVNRLEKSGYMSVYCNNPTGRDAALVSAKFKPRDLTLDLMLPIQVDDVANQGRKNLKLEPLEEGGLFRSVAMGLDKEGVALAAETIAALVASGKICLPGAAT